MRKTMKPCVANIRWILVVLILSSAATAWAYENRRSNENGVRVDVSPYVLTPNRPAQFQIRLNTHSVNLDQDLALVAELRDERGRTYIPVRWEGSPPGGHHRSGMLTFSKLPATVSEVTLTLRSVGGVAERNFSWKIE